MRKETFNVFLVILTSVMIVVFMNCLGVKTFGYSSFNILSGSMEESDIYQGDKVVVYETDILDLEIGDIIAFYASNDKNNNYALFDKSTYCESELLLIEEVNTTNYTKTEVWIHEITNIFIDDNDNIYYETKGTSNKSTDYYLAAANNVIGKHVVTITIFNMFWSFFFTSIGMLTIVVLPAFIVAVISLLSLIREL